MTEIQGKSILIELTRGSIIGSRLYSQEETENLDPWIFDEGEKCHETQLNALINKNHQKAIFNWAAKGLFFPEGRGRLYILRLP